MKKIILLLSITCLFANQMQVDGSLKVTGQIDASNYQIKNVGPPTDMFDAVNAQVLQDALRSDTNYEYKIYYLAGPNFYNTGNANYVISQGSGPLGWYELDNMYEGAGPNEFNTFSSEVSFLFNSGWNLQEIQNQWWIFRRAIDE